MELSMEDVLRDDVNIVKVGGDVYALTKVKCGMTDAVNSIRSHYENRMVEALNELQADAFGRADALADREFDKIFRALNANTVKIPREKQGQLVMSMNNELCSVRSIQFYITAIRGRLNRFNEEHTALCRKFPQYREEYEVKMATNQQHDMTVTFQVTPVASISYAKMAGCVLVNRRVYHAFNDMVGAWWKLCTGNVDANTFWTAQGFADSLRIINLDSPATRRMRFDVPNREFSTSDLITHFDCTYTITSVNEAGVGEGWATTGGAQ